ncbi:MAG: tetratricopeptide repeat protein, partial [Rhodothermales bacterium]|nr:tetratricopeptide repeat protein [Rhodothermales bacterium]
MLRNVCIVCAAVLLASCNSSSFVGRRVENFTAYYNTFYNAERVFADAEEATRVEDPPVNRDVYIDVFPVPDRVASRQNFENSIKKSADILREHENSKWADDALLLIGKSYFYTQNYVSAERYFADVIEVSEKLDGQARDWLGRTLLASGKNEEAVRHLTETLALDDVDRKTAAVLRLQLGSAYVKTGDYESARIALEEGIQTAKDKDMRARASFLLGQVHETLGNEDAAIGAYESAAKQEALYELSFASRFKSIELTASRDVDKALRDLRKMERDDKNFGYRAKLDLLRGRVLAAAGQYEEARRHIVSALSDNLRIDPESLGQTHYDLANLYEYHFTDYPRAAAHYDTASTNLRSTVQQAQISAVRLNVAQPFAPGAIIDATEKAEVFGSFARAYSDVERLDSLLVLGSLDEESFQEKIQELRRLRLEEMEEQRKASERRAIEQQFRNSGVATSGASERTAGKGAGGAGDAVSVSSESGFLSYKDPILMRSGVQNFVDLWGTRPLVDNWRIESKLIREAAAREGGNEETRDGGEGVITLDNIEFLPTIDVSDVPRSEAARENVRRERADARYLVGNVLFLAMEKPDSARYWYDLVVTEDSEFDVSVRALFALTEASRAAGDEAAAKTHEQSLVAKYPDSEFARRVRGEDASRDEQAQVDSMYIDLSIDYREAFTLWVDSLQHAQAFDRMLQIAGQSSDSVLTPRALFASTRIYHDWARLNDVNPLGPIRFEIADSLIELSGIIVAADSS